MHVGQSRLGISLVAAISLVLCGCAAGPDYKRPDALAGNTAPAFKENLDWKMASPGQVEVSERWWTGFGDSLLNDLRRALVAFIEVLLVRVRDGRRLDGGSHSLGCNPHSNDCTPRPSECAPGHTSAASPLHGGAGGSGCGASMRRLARARGPARTIVVRVRRHVYADVSSSPRAARA